MQHINGLVNVLPEDKMPILVKAGGTAARTYQFNGRDVVDSYVNFVKYNDDLYLVGIRENGIDELDPAITPDQQALAAAYPDRSVIWIDARTGKPMGLALKTEINPVPLAAQAAVYAWWRWGITDGPHGEKVIYTGYRYKILRYAPTGTVVDPAFPAGRATWSATPTEAFVEPVPGEPSGDESSGGDGSASWRYRAFRVEGHGPTTTIVAGGGTWRASHHPQEFVSDDGGMTLRPISRMDDRDNGGEKGSYSLGGLPSRYVAYPPDTTRPGLRVAYQGHYPATGWEARPNRYTINPSGDGVAPRLGGTGRPDFFDRDEAASGNFPAFAWESAGRNGIPLNHAVDGVARYDGNWVMTMDTRNGADYIVGYAIPSWNQQFGSLASGTGIFKPSWLGVHTLDGMIASGNSAVKIPHTEADEIIDGNGGTGHDYVYDVDVSVYPVAGAAANSGKSLVLAGFGNGGFGVFEVENVAPAIEAEPVDVTVDENRPVSIVATVKGSPNKYGWAKDGTALVDGPEYSKGLGEGVNKAILTIASAQVTNSGLYRLSITNPLGTLTTRSARLTVVADTTAPTLGAATAGRSPTTSYINVQFSEPVTAETAGLAANYAVSGGVTIEGVLVVAANRVTLSTSTLAPGTSYTVTVSNVKDVSANGNTIAAGSTATVVGPTLTPGFALWEMYRGLDGLGLPGTSVDILFGDPSFPNFAARRELLTAFTTGPSLNNAADSFGGRISAWITPTVSGSYRFFIRSDDASQLWISPNTATDNVSVIAEELGCCQPFLEPTNAEGVPNTQTSEPIALTAGQSYYLTAVYKEGGGGDFLDVAWRREGDTTAAAALTPIPGSVLSSYAAVAMEFGAATLANGQVTLTWTGGGRLQEATSLSGWVDVTGNPSSPLVVPASADQKFYRLVR